MDILVCYDVATDSIEGRRRLRRVAKVCENHGQRVQLSVFECSLNDAELLTLRDQLVRIIDEDQDSLRIYKLLGTREKAVEAFGRDRYVDFRGPLVC